MTLRELLLKTTCASELRQGSSSVFTRIKPDNIWKHLEDTVTAVTCRRGKLVIYANLPEYELEETTIDDVPWN